MPNSRRTLVLALFAMAAVTSAVHAQATLRYQFKAGDKLTYQLEQKLQISLTGADKGADTKTETLTMELTCTVLKVDPQGTAHIRVELSNARRVMKDAKGESDTSADKLFAAVLKVLSSMEMTGTLSATGEMKDFKASHASQKSLQELTASDTWGEFLHPDAYKMILSPVVFPTEAVAKGQSWTNKIAIKTVLGTTSAENTYTYDGPVEKDGSTLDKISVKLNHKTEPDAAGIIEMRVKEAKAAGQIYFNNKTGRLIESEMKVQMQVKLGPQGLTLHGTVDHTITLRAKK